MQDVIGASAKICEERGGRRIESYHLYVCLCLTQVIVI